MTTPLIEAADCTNSGNNTASTSWAVSHPAASVGDLLIFCLAWDDSTNVTSITTPTGPNGETLTSIRGPQASASTEIRIQVWYTVATGSWSAGTRTFTPSLSEQWTATVARVPAGEFHASTPIGTSNSRASGNTTSTTPSLWAFSAVADDANGRLCCWIGVDTDPITGTPSGWTNRASVDRGVVSGTLSTRDTAVSSAESIPQADWTIAGDSWATIGFIVREPAASGPTDYPYSASGGAVGGGSAGVSKGKVYVASGGAVGGGAATTLSARGYPYVASGGAVTGGAAVTSRTKARAFTASGGAVTSGSAVTKKGRSYAATGGAVGGGSAAVKRGRSFSASGGAVGGGSAALRRGKNFVASGGGVFSGAALLARTVARAYNASGGGIFGGSAEYSYGSGAFNDYDYVASGGGVFGGAATISRTRAWAYAAGGGGILGGEALTLPPPNIYAYEASGGAELGGGAWYFRYTLPVAESGDGRRFVRQFTSTFAS